MLKSLFTVYTNVFVYVLVFFLISCRYDNKVIDYPVVDNVSLSDGTTLEVSIVSDSLEVPWDIDYHSETNNLIYTEIGGRISRLDLSTGEKKELFTIEEVYQHRTLGLLGMCLHPDMQAFPYLYVTYTVKRNDSIYSRLERFTYKGDTLSNSKLLLEIPGNTGHNGARLSFSKGGKLLWATGDAHSKTFSQDSTSLNGKILRLNYDGSIPEDNPIKGSYVYAWGFRNMQGLTVSDRGYVYTSEHGDAIEDEINIIEPLRNYGWPGIEGKHDLPEEEQFAKVKNTKEPIRSWTPVIAPAGLAYYNSGAIPEWKNSLLLTTLKSQSLRVLKLDETGKEIESEQIFLENHYGRLRAVTVSSNGDVYIATSNRDWNPQPGFPQPGDDKILRLSRADKAVKNPLKGRVITEEKEETKSGEALYKAYCASCHKPDGTGLGAVFPALKASPSVTGEKSALINVLLNGSISETGPEQMPAFKFLSDEAAASILTYVRQSWGNSASVIKAGDIKKHRE